MSVPKAAEESLWADSREAKPELGDEDGAEDQLGKVEPGPRLRLLRRRSDPLVRLLQVGLVQRLVGVLGLRWLRERNAWPLCPSPT